MCKAFLIGTALLIDIKFKGAVMYTVHMAKECGCFKKSEYESTKTFETQRDAYNYSHVLAELMNDDFCSTHLFTAQKLENDDFMITVVDNPNAGSCGTESSGSCGTSCGC